MSLRHVSYTPFIEHGPQALNGRLNLALANLRANKIASYIRDLTRGEGNRLLLNVKNWKVGEASFMKYQRDFEEILAAKDCPAQQRKRVDGKLICYDEARARLNRRVEVRLVSVGNCSSRRVNRMLDDLTGAVAN